MSYFCVLGTPANGDVPTYNSVTDEVEWAPAAPSQWTTVGSDIYYNTGKVGIGNTAPTSKLHLTTNAIGNNPTTALTGGVLLQNTTIATNILNQFSPAIRVQGSSWNTSLLVPHTITFTAYLQTANGNNTIGYSNNGIRIDSSEATNIFSLSVYGALTVNTVISPIGAFTNIAAPGFGSSNQILRSDGASPIGWYYPAFPLFGEPAIGSAGVDMNSNSVDFINVTQFNVNGIDLLTGLGAVPTLLQTLTQTSSSPPNVNGELINTTGDTFTWNYLSTGIYSITSSNSGTFVKDRTAVVLSLGVNAGVLGREILYYTFLIDTENIEVHVLEVGVGYVDDILEQASFKVEIVP